MSKITVLHASSCATCSHFHKTGNGDEAECWYWPPVPAPVFAIPKGGSEPMLVRTWAVRPPVREDMSCGQWKASIQVARSMS